MPLDVQSVKFPTQTAMRISVLVHSREFYKCLTCSLPETFWNSSHDWIHDGGHGVQRTHRKHMKTKPAFQTLGRATFTVVRTKSACKGEADGHQRHSSPVTPHLTPEDENSPKTLLTRDASSGPGRWDLYALKGQSGNSPDGQRSQSRKEWQRPH